MSEKKESGADIEKYDKVKVLEEEYIVEKILDKKKVGSAWKYKVKWEGYPEEECTWEPRENLRNVKYLIDEYEEKFGDKKEPKNEKTNLLKNKTKRNNTGSNKDVSFRDEENSNSIISSDRAANDMTKSQKQLIASLSHPDTKELNLKENKEKEENKTEEQQSQKITNFFPKDNNSVLGNLDTDVPLKIINAKILDDNDVNINCLVKWKPRNDGYVPEPDWISSKILKIKCPMILFDFYESRIKFPKKENK